MPPIAYPGGKARMAPRIVALMDPHRVYVEPYAGTASVLFAKPRVQHEIINDLDSVVATFLRVVRDRPDELAAHLALTPYSREVYLASDPRAATDEIEIARETAVRICQGFAKTGLADTKTGWRISIRSRSCAGTWARLPDRIIDCAERLRGVHIENQPAINLVRRYGPETDAVLYVDPPYLGDTRHADMYKHEQMGEDDHRELAEALRTCKAHVLLSGYASDLYEDLYDGWHRAEFAAIANNNGTAGAAVRRTEVLWMNRAAVEEGAFDLGEAA